MARCSTSIMVVPTVLALLAAVVLPSATSHGVASAQTIYSACTSGTSKQVITDENDGIIQRFGGYSNNELCQWLIQCPTGRTFQVTDGTYLTEANFDELQVQQVSTSTGTTGGTVLAEWSGNAGSGSFAAISPENFSDDRVVVEFDADSSFVESDGGYSLSWACSTSSVVTPIPSTVGVVAPTPPTPAPPAGSTCPEGEEFCGSTCIPTEGDCCIPFTFFTSVYCPADYHCSDDNTECIRNGFEWWAYVILAVIIIAVICCIGCCIKCCCCATPVQQQPVMVVNGQPQVVQGGMVQQPGMVQAQAYPQAQPAAYPAAQPAAYPAAQPVYADEPKQV